MELGKLQPQLLFLLLLPPPIMWPRWIPKQKLFFVNRLNRRKAAMALIMIIAPTTNSIIIIIIPIKSRRRILRKTSQKVQWKEQQQQQKHQQPRCPHRRHQYVLATAIKIILNIIIITTRHLCLPTLPPHDRPLLLLNGAASWLSPFVNWHLSCLKVFTSSSFNPYAILHFIPIIFHRIFSNFQKKSHVPRFHTKLATKTAGLHSFQKFVSMQCRSLILKHMVVFYTLKPLFVLKCTTEVLCLRREEKSARVGFIW